ncbi:DUF695 domain-containing protein [Roseovarius pacificus]|uniref:DUF695 domain-containing protein n=1 Tax=Roseovarius pacificus TaxID=337701 RepID=UPI002A18785E|nr:DUF695 domain-containing protein [Roseovarius pacificus]
MRNFFRRKQYEIPDSWAVCHVGGDRRATMRINTPLEGFVHKADFSISTVFAISLSSFDAESDIPIIFEDALFEQLQDSGLGIIAAIVTNSETRDFITYVKNEKSGPKIKQLMRANFPTVQMDISSQADVEWSLFHNLLPSL